MENILHPLHHLLVKQQSRFSARCLQHNCDKETGSYSCQRLSACLVILQWHLYTVSTKLHLSTVYCCTWSTYSTLYSTSASLHIISIIQINWLCLLIVQNLVLKWIVCCQSILFCGLWSSISPSIHGSDLPPDVWRCWCAGLTFLFCRWSTSPAGSSGLGCWARRRATCRCAGSAGSGLALVPPVGGAPSPPGNSPAGSCWA